MKPVKTMKTSRGKNLDYWHYGSLQEQISVLRTYKMKRASNASRFENVIHSDEEGVVRWRGCLADEAKNMTNFIEPELLKKMYLEVQDRVASIPMTSVKNGITFSKNRHVFVAERYHKGSKRPFATRGSKNKNIPQITIGVNQGYDAKTKVKDAMYNAIASVVFADILQKSGYSVRILAVFSASYSSRGEALCTSEVKPFSSRLDIDTVAMAVSDPRFFRYTVLGSSYVHADIREWDMPSGSGYPFNKRESKQRLDSLDIKVDYMFGGDRSMEQAVASLKTALAKVEMEAKRA